MSKFCIKCGNPLPDDAVFCGKCGTRQPSVGAAGAAAGAASAQQVRKAQAAQPQYAQHAAQPLPPTQARQAQQPSQPLPPAQAKQPRQQASPTWNQTARTQNARAVSVQKKKSGGCLKRVVAVGLAAVLIFTGFVKPGFVLKWIRGLGDPTVSTEGNVTDPTFSSTNDPRHLSDKPPTVTEVTGNSKAYEGSPCPGFTVSAPKNTFAKDTEIRISPLTQASAATLDAAEKIEAEGYMLIGGHEFSTGLEDGEFSPGDFTVTVDLSVLGIDPALYDYVRVFHVGGDGSWFQYNASVTDGKMTFSSDVNAFLFWAISAAIIGAVYKGLSNYEAGKSVQYFYDTKKEKFTCEGNNGYIDYKIIWAPVDLGIDSDELIRKCEEITRKYMAKKDELYKKYQEDHLFEASSILSIFSRGKDATEVLWDAVNADQEYQELQKKLKVPEPVEFAIQCITNACKFLKYDFVRMPTGVVEFVSVTTLDSSVLAEQTTRNFHEGYVEMNLKQVLKANQTQKNDFLLTITHELLHVCQQKYRFFWADSNRYDEMAAVFMETRALSYYLREGIIAYDEQPPLSSVDYWTTLKLPIDNYYAGKDGREMKHEGYNLGSFVQYLKDKTGSGLNVNDLMKARSSLKQPGVSEPLMYAFRISEQEFDIHYRNWIRVNKEAIVRHYDNKEPEQYKRNAEIPIAKGGKYHVDVRPEGSYCTEVRGFQQPNAEAMTLLLVPDKGFSTDQPQCNLIPYDRYETISKGVWIYPKRSMNNKNRDIIEIHGAMGKSKAEKSTGYTIYVLDKTKMPILSEDEENLIVKMPENSYVADDKIIDGYLLTIQTGDGLKIEREIGQNLFEKQIKIAKTDLYGKKALSEELDVTVTLCEYVKKTASEKLMGEVSDVVEYTLGAVVAKNLERFSACWIPTEYGDRLDGDIFVIGLIYVQPDSAHPDGEFGYFERQLKDWEREGLWTEISEFDYDERTGELVIVFEKGPATFWIDDKDIMHMTNSGGTWPFYRYQD